MNASRPATELTEQLISSGLAPTPSHLTRVGASATSTAGRMFKGRRPVDVSACRGLSGGYSGSVAEVRMELAHGAPAAPVRRWVGDALRDWNVSPCAADVLLVCTELVQNVTQHTAGGGELRMLLRTRSVLIEVTDSSVSLPSLPDMDLCRVGGRGMLLVAAIAIAWGSRTTTWAGRTGKVVWAELSLTPMI